MFWFSNIFLIFARVPSLKGSRYSLLATNTIWPWGFALFWGFGTFEPTSGIFPKILLLRRTYQNGHDSCSIHQEPGRNRPTSNRRDLYTFCVGSTRLWSNLYLKYFWRENSNSLKSTSCGPILSKSRQFVRPVESSLICAKPKLK